ncbi:MAG: hypothetical protein EOO84_10990 [Pantoea sp.]|uniref:hypothetical protein n=1 Tax=Pantoea sp. TaxID=69393 RepID=UPI0012265B7B|nr:hypothetical protein [Pantoea sp.]RZK07207.1 MAG: hypothetical protein EOO84_10990 [Pantoea sp.]
MDTSVLQSNTWFFSLGSIILVLIGWRVVYNNAKKLATRAESKAIVDHLIKLANEISDVSVKFWSAKDEESDAEFKSAAMAHNVAIGAKISQLNNFVDILLNRDINIDFINIAEIQIQATLDSEQRKGLKLDGRLQRCQESVNACMYFIEHVYKQFEETHPPHLPKIARIFYLDDFDQNCSICRRSY